MKADPKADAAPAANGKKKLMVIVIAAVLVAGLAGGAAWFFTKGSADAEETGGAHKGDKKKKKSDKDHPAVYVVLEQFTVNLQPENGADQYLQLACTLQVNSPEQEELLKANMPKVRSRILLLLSGKKASEISSVEGKKKLAEEIIKVSNEPFVEHGEPQEVSDVLFTSFIIQ
ncbi:flagellar basal body-associated protein FliL [Massilia arenosa]|uniref:Flagellar protein FliL n=1 Tax=Zemynaea arenosa TaxID=2561931 RepID=A0A4Y9SKT3_9BURK|nr:flagellar basal body-associated protein FliL [Massilia arenosa]TFW27148.1 flagellar basal body-associated protein FliL [Massilia arenosa]